MARNIAPRLIVMVGAGVMLLAACGRPDSQDSRPTIGEARAELRGYIEDVTQATASRFRVVDDRGHEMDTLKIISVPESGGFVGLYHSYRVDTGTFAVHLATSGDLMNWTWRRQLGDNASMPTITPASDGGYVVAWEQESPNHIRLMYYRSWSDLLTAAPSKTFDAPLRPLCGGHAQPVLGEQHRGRCRLSLLPGLPVRSGGTRHQRLALLDRRRSSDARCRAGSARRQGLHRRP